MKKLVSNVLASVGLGRHRRSRGEASGTAAACGTGFFPNSYKQFPFNEGDLLATRTQEGRFRISKVLKIDRIDIPEGGKINLQGREYVVDCPDHLLVIGSALGKEEYPTLDAARRAAARRSWTVWLSHVPSRAPTAAEGQLRVGHERVRDEELTAYRLWRAEFDAGEAGIF